MEILLGNRGIFFMLLLAESSSFRPFENEMTKPPDRIYSGPHRKTLTLQEKISLELPKMQEKRTTPPRLSKRLFGILKYGKVRNLFVVLVITNLWARFFEVFSVQIVAWIIGAIQARDEPGVWACIYLFA